MDFYESTLQWACDMLLCDKIRLEDVPKEIRATSGAIYITALRISNIISCERFVQDLTILAQDICTLPPDHPNRHRLIQVLRDRIEINDHKGEDALESFQKNLFPEILQELQRSDAATHEMLRQCIVYQAVAGEKSGTGIIGDVE